MRNDYLVFGGVNTRDFNVGIYGDQLAAAPERDRSFVSVPGKNGDVELDNGKYNNITVAYKAYIAKDYETNIRALRNALLSKTGYQRLEDTINPDEFRLGIALPFDVKEAGVLRAGEFTLQFNCKPQRFLKVGEMPIEATTTKAIFNGYSQTALPLIRAYGTGTFTISGITVKINTADVYTDIDCELMEAFKDTMANNCNGNIELTEFPKLFPGYNQISMVGITKLEIIPRYWML